MVGKTERKRMGGVKCYELRGIRISPRTGKCERNNLLVKKLKGKTWDERADRFLEKKKEAELMCEKTGKADRRAVSAWNSATTQKQTLGERKIYSDRDASNKQIKIATLENSR